MAVATAVKNNGVAADNVAAMRRAFPKLSVAINANISSGFSPMISKTEPLSTSAIISGKASPDATLCDMRNHAATPCTFMRPISCMRPSEA